MSPMVYAVPIGLAVARRAPLIDSSARTRELQTSLTLPFSQVFAMRDRWDNLFVLTGNAL